MILIFSVFMNEYPFLSTAHDKESAARAPNLMAPKFFSQTDQLII